MRAALVSVTQGDTYYSEMLDYRYGGFSYEVYDGDADTGTLLGGSKPESYALRQTLTESYHSTQDSGGELSETTPESTPEDAGTSGFYTVVGYLSDQLPRSSIFSLSRWVYRTVYPVSYTHLDVYKRQISFWAITPCQMSTPISTISSTSG